MSIKFFLLVAAAEKKSSNKLASFIIFGVVVPGRDLPILPSELIYKKQIGKW